MKFPALWLSFVSELAKVIYLVWDLGSRSYITLHFCAKAKAKAVERGIKLSNVKMCNKYVRQRLGIPVSPGMN